MVKVKKMELWIYGQGCLIKTSFSYIWLSSECDDGVTGQRPRAPTMLSTFRKRTLSLVYLLAAFLLLATTAEKARQLVGEDVSSQSGKFTWINCFDMGSGSLACVVKEGVKSYIYNIRAGHLGRVRQKAFEIAYTSALSEGKEIQVAAKEATKAGAKAEKLASRQTRRILGPISAAGWDAFEAIYYGGTMVEAVMRGLGTVSGAYWGGFQGEANLGRIGYLIGSHLGSWIGGRVGLMVYDISVGAHFLMNTYLAENNEYTPYSDENPEISYPEGEL